MNRKIEEMIRCTENYSTSNWDEYLVIFEVAYSTSQQATNTSNPFYFNHDIETETISIRKLHPDSPAASNSIYDIQEATGVAQSEIRKPMNSTLDTSTESDHINFNQ